MRRSPPRLLGVAALTALSMVAACKLDKAGLEPGLGQMDAVVPDASTGGSGAAGTGAAGTSAISGGAGANATAGTTGGAGDGAIAGVAGGAAEQGSAGAAGQNDQSGAAGDLGMATGDAGTPGVPDAGGAGGSTVQPTDAGPPAWVVGCADGTREGLLSLARFPDVAACSGAWSVAGMVAPETLTPQCNRGGGNDGDHPDGQGCSVADLCADGWHVCESAREFAEKATNCDEAFPGGAVKMFFATRQRGPMTTCDPDNEMGTNNVYGCGNFGSNAMAACAPFMHMLRDADCKNNPPWSCVDGPINLSTSELLDVTKPGSEHGGVLCCR